MATSYKRRFAALIGAIVLASVAAVGTAAATPSPHAVAGGTYPVTVNSPFGKVTLKHRPTRIISLSPTTTEMLFAIGAGKQVIAVDSDSDYPKNAPRTSLSGYTPNVEAIAGKRPDLVVISYNPTPPNLVASLKVLGIPTLYVPAASNLRQTYAEIEQLGRLTGHVSGAAAVVRSMQHQLTALVAELPTHHQKLTYFYELDPTLYTATSDTFIGSVLGDAGLKNIVPHAVAGSDYPQISSEVVVRANPTFIFLADGASISSVAKRPGWSQLTAVRDHRVIELNEDIASRWGPRTVDLLKAVVPDILAVEHTSSAA